MPSTISDIAREAGLARSTVADILRGRPGYSDETRRRVNDTARRLDFVPNYFARSLSRRRSHTIGIVCHLGVAGILAPTIAAISAGLRDEGYMALLCERIPTQNDLSPLIRVLRERRVDGVILESDSDVVAIRQDLSPDLPFVMIRSTHTAECPTVCADRYDAFTQGVEWLAARGHRRIAFQSVAGVESRSDEVGPHIRKVAGYCDAMRRLGLYDDSLLLNSDATPGSVRESVVANAEVFRRVTAILACNDRTALEVITGLTELGLRVPEDCSVIGFDDTEYAMSSKPRLTSFDPRRAEVGERAATMILKSIAGEDVPSVRLTPKLIVRESAGPCRASDGERGQ